MSAVFYTVFYNPIYNALVALLAVIPGSDVGIAIIMLTIVIRLILLPFSLAAARTQRAMKILEPRIKELKEKHKGDKEKEALETLALYREAKVNPFSSILTVFVQIPVLLALYFVFRYEPFSTFDTIRLYAFTPLPANVSVLFLGFIPVLEKSVVLAALAGLSQLLQARLALAGTLKPSGGTGMQADFQKVMGLQLTFVFPVLIAIITYTTSGAIGLYFITTNLAGSLQEWYVRRTLATEADAIQELKEEQSLA